MSNKLSTFLSADEIIFGTLLLLLSIFITAESRWSRLNSSIAISSDHPIHLYFDNSTELSSLSKTLRDSQIINKEQEFLWAARLLGWKKFSKGHYLVDRNYSYQEFLSKLGRGIQDPVKVTILPGKNKAQIAGDISQSMQFDSLDFHQALNDSLFLAKQGLGSQDVLGRLYPNTYALFWTSSSKSTLKRIFREFDSAVGHQYKQRIDSLDYSLNQVITMASIVQWEAKSKKEEPVIAELYWNRLDRGMRMQADPTVNYAIGERRRLLYEDYKTESPYNTYLIRGLPPGPITNPSISAIRASLYPKEHDYLYMVATPEGTHAFSKTFKAHKQKSAKWRRWIRKQHRIKEKRNQ